MEQKVSIIIPVIRKESAEKCIKAIVKNAGVPTYQYEILTEFDTDGIGCPKMVEKLTAKTEHDFVMFLGDDTIPEKDFLKYALEAMATLPDGWGVVGLNTLDIRIETGNPLAHWMAHKKMLEHIPGGNFFSTEYEHCFCDNELKDIADDLGRWVNAKKCKITHVHPVNKTASYDEVYQKAYDKGKFGRDRKTYFTRKRARMKARSGVKLAIAVPLVDDKVYNQFLFSFVKVVTDYITGQNSKGKIADVDILFPDFPCQVDAARNNLVKQALVLGCTHIIFMDSDQIYVTDNLIDKMLAHNKPVLSARVHRRYPPFDPILLMGDVGHLYQIPDEDFRNKDGTFKSEVNVDFTGTGCILYDMKIFSDMSSDKFFEFTTGEQGQPVGEDIGMCDKLGKMGIPIIVDCTIDIKHLTLLAADYGTYALFKKIMQ